MTFKFKFLFVFFSVPFLTIAQNNSFGLFENSKDIGDVNHPGSAEYNSENKTYIVSGSGENMWFNEDAFHFIYKKISGDVSLAATIEWAGEGVHYHRKAGVIIRQNLDPDSPYADAITHGDGLTSLQYRDEKGGLTHQIEIFTKPLKKIRLKIKKEGDNFYMSFAENDEELKPAGGSYRIKFEEPFYIGLAVCSHDSTVIEKAVFSDVEITTPNKNLTDEKMLISSLETISIESKDRRIIYTTDDHIEAPNWSQNGEYFLFNSNGLIYSLPVNGGSPSQIVTAFATKCNNDHGISPDGKQLAISDETVGNKSLIYTLPIEGGTPKLITENGPSYWHGWSPDGNTLAYCAERNGNYDIYTISVDGGEEKRLTDAEGLDDGPDYSPDGKYIYFNSERTGRMQIWRMNADGSDQQQITDDEFNNWFPHPSPDGKWVVFLSYEKDIEEHPANKNVTLRLLSLENGDIQELTRLFGGQGTINVPSWSQDSKGLAFISYRLK